MAALGVQVTLVCRGMILKQLDRDIVDELMKNMKNLGVEIRLDSQHTSVS
jgi:pyruvate/2-oxoglutarate dehydrogenase complex dihydrolipoamide dehydrogenase (E3) component